MAISWKSKFFPHVIYITFNKYPRITQEITVIARCIQKEISKNFFLKRNDFDIF